MKKKIVFLIVALMGLAQVYAQKYMTRNGHIWFYSHAPLEDIEAHNNQVSSIIDLSTGNVAFSLLMKAFQFEKALMQEHFNEKYVHSDKFPKATFKGKIVNLDGIDATKEGEYPAKVKGELSIHGVTKEVEVEGKITFKDGKMLVNATFPVAVADYDIKIPAVVADNIAKVVDVHVEMSYDPM